MNGFLETLAKQLQTLPHATLLALLRIVADEAYRRGIINKENKNGGQ